MTSQGRHDGKRPVSRHHTTHYTPQHRRARRPGRAPPPPPPCSRRRRPRSSLCRRGVVGGRTSGRICGDRPGAASGASRLCPTAGGVRGSFPGDDPRLQPFSRSAEVGACEPQSCFPKTWQPERALPHTSSIATSPLAPSILIRPTEDSLLLSLSLSLCLSLPLRGPVCSRFRKPAGRCPDPHCCAADHRPASFAVPEQAAWAYTHAHTHTHTYTHARTHTPTSTPSPNIPL